jgi:hypothetical protein
MSALCENGASRYNWGMYCVYCNLDHAEEVPLNEEHIIPQAIGGTRAWTIRVCEKSNSKLGNDVDNPFMESFLVNTDRFLYNLQSYRSAPTLDLSGTAQIAGRTTQVTYKVQGDTKVLKLTRPERIVQHVEGKVAWDLSGDPEDVRRILLGKLAAVEKSGGYLTDNLTGERITLEAIDIMVKNRSIVLDPPSVSTHCSFSGGDAVRFLCKMALAAGFKEFGEAFGRSAVAERLRAEMKRADADLELPGAFWPFVTHDHMELAKPFTVEDSHVIAFLHDEESAVFISLFSGKYHALVPLSDGGPLLEAAEQKVVRLNIKTKSFVDSSFGEYLLARPWRA